MARAEPASELKRRAHEALGGGTGGQITAQVEPVEEFEGRLQPQGLANSNNLQLGLAPIDLVNLYAAGTGALLRRPGGKFAGDGLTGLAL